MIVECETGRQHLLAGAKKPTGNYNKSAAVLGHLTAPQRHVTSANAARSHRRCFMFYQPLSNQLKLGHLSAQMMGPQGGQVPAARRSDGPTAAGRDAASRTAGPTGSPCAAAGASGRQLPGAAGVGAAAPAAAPGVRVGARLGQAPGHGMVVRQGCPCNTRSGRCDRLVMHPVKVRAIHGPAAGIRSFARVSLDAGYVARPVPARVPRLLSCISTLVARTSPW